MTEIKTCPECGAALPPDAPAGVCPKCLLHAGLDDAETEQEHIGDARKFLVAAVVIATILVGVSELAGVGTIANTPIHPLESYIWDGWYWVFFYGAWNAGIVIGLILGALWPVRLLRRCLPNRRRVEILR